MSRLCPWPTQLEHQHGNFQAQLCVTSQQRYPEESAIGMILYTKGLKRNIYCPCPPFFAIIFVLSCKCADSTLQSTGGTSAGNCTGEPVRAQPVACETNSLHVNHVAHSGPAAHSAVALSSVPLPQSSNISSQSYLPSKSTLPGNAAAVQRTAAVKRSLMKSAAPVYSPIAGQQLASQQSYLNYSSAAAASNSSVKAATAPLSAQPARQHLSSVHQPNTLGQCSSAAPSLLSLAQPLPTSSVGLSGCPIPIKSEPHFQQSSGQPIIVPSTSTTETVTRSKR